MRDVLATRNAKFVVIFPAGNNIILKHRIMIVIFDIFFMF